MGLRASQTLNCYSHCSVQRRHYNLRLKRQESKLVKVSRHFQSFFNLLIPNVHDRAFRVLVNNIKPTAVSRVLEKVVMRVV